MGLRSSPVSLLCVQHLCGLGQETWFGAVNGKTLLIVPSDALGPGSRDAQSSASKQ